MKTGPVGCPIKAITLVMLSAYSPEFTTVFASPRLLSAVTEHSVDTNQAFPFRHRAFPIGDHFCLFSVGIIEYVRLDHLHWPVVLKARKSKCMGLPSSWLLMRALCCFNSRQKVEISDHK